jgi:hypothetical protein
LTLRLSIFLIMGGIPLASLAQHNTSHTNMVWVGYYNTFSINKNWSLLTDAQIRTREWTRNWSQMLVRSGLNYRINDRLSITGGFAFFKNAQYADKRPIFKNEFRPWQELVYQSKLKMVNLTQRLRGEQRFQQQVINDQKTQTSQFFFRLRYRFEAQLPLQSNKLAFLVADEIMVNPGYIHNALFFDQNRSFAGLNIKLQANTALQLQYVKIFQLRSNGPLLENQDVVRVNLVQKFSYKKNINKSKTRPV